MFTASFIPQPAQKRRTAHENASPPPLAPARARRLCPGPITFLDEAIRRERHRRLLAGYRASHPLLAGRASRLCLWHLEPARFRPDLSLGQADTPLGIEV